MASTMASTFALSRPSEKFGTHSTSVDITGKNIGQVGEEATRPHQWAARSLIANEAGTQGTHRPQKARVVHRDGYMNIGLSILQELYLKLVFLRTKLKFVGDLAAG